MKKPWDVQPTPKTDALLRDPRRTTDDETDHMRKLERRMRAAEKLLKERESVKPGSTGESLLNLGCHHHLFAARTEDAE